MKTPQEIIENNKLIAEFMGCKEKKHWRDNNETIGYGFDDTHITNYWLVSEFIDVVPYHFSWYWLMPVLEKICRMKIGDDIITVAYATPRTFGMLSEETGKIMVRLNGFQCFSADTLLEAIYLAIVDFIKFYNEKLINPPVI